MLRLLGMLVQKPKVSKKVLSRVSLRFVHLIKVAQREELLLQFLHSHLVAHRHLNPTDQPIWVYVNLGFSDEVFYSIHVINHVVSKFGHILHNFLEFCERNALFEKAPRFKVILSILLIYREHPFRQLYCVAFIGLV